MNKPRFPACLTAGLTCAALLAGCGGGGGGGGGAGGGGVTNPPVYSGNTNAAIITPTNASKLAANVFGSGDTATTSLALAIQGASSTQGSGSGLVHSARRLNRSVRDVAQRASTAPRLASGVLIDDTEPCDGGMGFVRTSGTLNDTSFTGILDVFYNLCLIDGLTVHGPAKLRIDAFSFAFPQGIPSDSTLIYEKLEIRGPGVSVDEGGSLRDQLNFAINTEIVTLNLVTRDNNTGKTSRDENLVLTYVYDNILTPSLLTASISGRLFDHDHGFVNISTNTLLFFGTLTQLYPSNGQIVMTGSGNAKIRATALSELLSKLELDLNGDNVYENDATLKWSELNGPVGADLRDSDGDRIHNSWETANGLDPFSPADALLDMDGDGASNLAEYQSGTDLRNPGSIPPTVGLSLSASGTGAVVVGNSLLYTIDVINSSQNSAIDVVVTDTLPSGVNLVSITPTRGSCTGTSVLTCNLGTLDGLGQANVTIFVIPTIEGILSNTVSVTTNSFDPDLSDNSATSTTIVGKSLENIQSLIDGAAPGNVVLVDPGIYVGSLKFNGKDITVQSSAGPESTSITSVGTNPVVIGPGGAIRGFTILRSFTIAVIGQGSLISGNIFDGNVQPGGLWSAAVGGNSASPTIERNVFRNNVCDNQQLSGVIAFINDSSPIIANNIFENNPCRAINLTLPAGNVPQVVNNTLVGNQTGIRVDRRVPQTAQIFRNNLIMQNGIGLEIEFGTDADNPLWQNNLVFGNTTDYQGAANQTGVNGNISADPMFVNGAAGNYRLQPGSPAINAGSSVGVPNVDFDGTTRPINGSWDIGAFEAP